MVENEATLHGNIALALQSLHMPSEALHHYEQHLKIAIQCNDQRSMALAQCNLGVCFFLRTIYDLQIRRNLVNRILCHSGLVNCDITNP